jgi:hypothetical protein
MNYEWIKQFENTELFNIGFHLILINENCKKSFSVLWNNLEPGQRKWMEHFQIMIQRFGLNYKMIAKDFIFVSKNNDQKYIPKKYPKETFYQSKIAYLFEINQNLMIKIKYEPNESKIQKKIQEWNHLMNKLNLNYRFRYEMFSRKNLFDKFRDKVYVSNHLQLYSHLLLDEFYEKTRFSETKMILEKWNSFLLLMEMISNKDIIQLYKNTQPYSIEYFELVKQLNEFEKDLISVV